jgi:hypothetical protein
VSIVQAQRKEASRKAEEETEASRENGDETGELAPQAEASDHPMDSADVVVLLLRVNIH